MIVEGTPVRVDFTSFTWYGRVLSLTPNDGDPKRRIWRVQFISSEIQHAQDVFENNLTPISEEELFWQNLAL
jgi:hypothetical protein